MARRLPLAGALLCTAVLVGVVAASVWTSPALASVTVTCTTPVDAGGCSDFTVPSGVTSVTFQVWGADGGAGGTAVSPCSPSTGGRLGGYVTATYSVSPYQTFHLDVGAKGDDGSCGESGGAGGTGGAGGVGGDGNGGIGGSGSGTSNLGGGGGGGGESDIRFGGTSSTNRVVTAGGGGGAAAAGATGGAGGGSHAGDGGPSGVATASGGAGATTGAVGAGGSSGSGTPGSDGSSAIGGAGGVAADAGGAGGGGGGGGGFYGGGGGGAGASGDGGGGGGGGSGAASGGAGIALVSFSQSNGVEAGNGGNGKIVISYVVPPHTRPAANVTATSATLRGYDWNNDTYHFEYGPTTSYGSTTPSATATTGVSLDQPVTGLQPGTTYHYRIVSSEGGPGADIDFTTSSLPVVSLPVTGSATGVTATSATIQGTDPTSGESYHFEYGLTSSYGTSTPAATSNGGTLSATLAGLRSGVTYHFRIVSDTGAGSDATFTTLHLPVTLPASAVTASSARLEGIDANSGTSYQFQWGSTTAYGHSTAAGKAAGTTDTLSAAISGLAPGRTYHFRIVDSSAGAGQDKTFTTTNKARDLVLGIHGPATGRVGQSLRYVATIGSKGTKAVKGSKLRLVFKGAKVQVVSAKGCTGSVKLTCKLPKIAARKAVRVKVVVRVSTAALLKVQGSLVLTFTDPTPKNDRVVVRTKVK